jgi:hypothetical protein
MAETGTGRFRERPRDHVVTNVSAARAAREVDHLDLWIFQLL